MPASRGTSTSVLRCLFRQQRQPVRTQRILHRQPMLFRPGAAHGRCACSLVGDISILPPVQKSIPVAPEGTLNARVAGGLGLEIETEDQKCDEIGFEAVPTADGTSPLDSQGLQLHARGEWVSELQAGAAGDGDVDRSRPPVVRGLIPEKYNVDIVAAGGGR